MNGAQDSDAVTPEFRAHLEWQIQSALRRESRFGVPVQSGSPRGRLALMLAAAMAAGGIAVGASTELQDARQRDALIETARSEESLVKLRVDLARAEYEEVRKRFEIGAVDRETLQAAERELRAMEAALARLHLDIEETRLTAAAPRNDLQAPVVGDRDFVRERLMLELTTAQRHLAAADDAIQQIRQRVAVGLAPEAALMQAELELASTRAGMEQLRGTLELRDRLIRGEIDAEAMAALQRRMVLTLQRDHLRRSIEMGRKRIQDLQRQVEVGVASRLDLKRAEVDLLERETELQRVQRELDSMAAARR